MPATNHNFAFYSTSTGNLGLRSAKGDRILSVPEAFAIGCSMIRTGKPAVAIRVFDELARRYPHEVQFATMLARSFAQIGDYQRCNSMLQSAFADADFATPVKLQAAFVYEAHGMRSSARSALEEPTARHPEIPLLCLLQGDYFLRQGDRKRAERCWSSAIDGDAPNGYIAFVATRNLKRLSQGKGMRRWGNAASPFILRRSVRGVGRWRSV